MDIINTYDQLKANGGGIAICYHPPGSIHGCKWVVMLVNKEGKVLKTEPSSSWYEHGMKAFYINKVRKEKHFRLKEAIQWVDAKYCEKGPWVRNRMGDYVPERINESFPQLKR